MLHAQINNYVSADADTPRLLHVFALNSTTKNQRKFSLIFSYILNFKPSYS